MGSKNVSLRDEAYERLNARRREGESFSDVVMRITDGDEDLSGMIGLWTGTDKAEAARRAVEESKESIGGEYAPSRR